MMKLIKTRRSIREFLDKDIPNNLIERIIEAGIWAPSACNLQPVVYVIIKNKQDKQEIVEKGKAQPILLKAPIVIAVFYDTILVQKNYANIQSASAAIQNMLLYAHSIKIGSLWVGGCDNKEFVRKFLNVPEKYDLCAFVLLGYSESKPLPPKRSFDTLYYNKYVGINPSNESFLKDWKFDDTLAYQDKISRRGFRLEDVSEGEITQIINYIKPYLKGKILDYHNFSASFLSELQKNHDIAGHFFSKDVKTAAFMYNKDLKDKNIILRKIKSKFDTICSFYKLEHIPNLEEYLKEINLLLNKDGQFVIVTTDNFSWKGLLDFYFRKLRRKNTLGDTFYSSLINIGPWNYLSKGKLRKELKNSGFKIIKSKKLFVLPEFEVKESVLIKSRLNSRGYALISFIFEKLNKLLNLIGLSRLFGKSLIIICKRV